MSKWIATFPSAFVLLVPFAIAQGIPSGPIGGEQIHQELERARTVASALMIAAHPDDENTAVLAWLARGRHVRTGYLSLTRGEGGQNLLGSEQGAALGLLRTQELLDARRIDGAEQFFTRAIDFGFCKTPKEAIEKWGHDAILSDIVWVIRKFQPDVIILRFTGTPSDGHGHHQASAILGREAYEAAADPAQFSDQLKFVRPWRAKRLVWNAFTFTPEQEKEAAAMPNRVSADVGEFNADLGRSYGEIAGISRSQHKSQGMGVPEQRGSDMQQFVARLGDTAKNDLFDGVDMTWNRLDAPQIGALLDDAEKEFDASHPERMLPMIEQAETKAEAIAQQGNPMAQRKLGDLKRLIALCSGLWIDANSDRYAASPGEPLKVSLELIKRLNVKAKLDGVEISGLGLNAGSPKAEELPDNKAVKREVQLQLPANAAPSQPFWLQFPPDGDRYTIPNQQLIGVAAPSPVLEAHVKLEIDSTPLTLTVPVHFRYVDHVRGELVRPFEVLPKLAVNLPVGVFIFPQDGAANERKVAVAVRANGPNVEGETELRLPKGWTAKPSSPTAFKLSAAGDQQEVTFQVRAPRNAGSEPQTFEAAVRMKSGEYSTSMQRIDYEHIPPQVIFKPAAGKLEPLDLKVLARNVGYVMGAGDAVPDAIRQMGCEVTLLDADDLLRSDLSKYDAIVTGVRAFNVRPDLRAAHSRLLDYVRDGGTLVVQYNVIEFSRMSGKQTQPPEFGPYNIQISHDRVVDEDSPVTLVDPGCPLLTLPNRIGPKDFQGWIQERGLYFADKWDPHYQTVLSTHDPGEKDLSGGMLYAAYGKGAYVFTAYSWFRELPAGVPGAYRIFANLLSAGRALTLSKSGSPDSTAH